MCYRWLILVCNKYWNTAWLAIFHNASYAYVDEIWTFFIEKPISHVTFMTGKFTLRVYNLKYSHIWRPHNLLYMSPFRYHIFIYFWKLSIDLELTIVYCYIYIYALCAPSLHRVKHSRFLITRVSITWNHNVLTIKHIIGPQPKILIQCTSDKQYIPRNMHTVVALLCSVVVIHWLISLGKTRRALDRKVHRGRRPRVETLMSFRRTQAQARRLFTQKKRESWTRYVSQLNTNTPIKHVWNIVRKISGKNVCSPKQYLNGKDGAPITDPKDIANEHAAAFTDNSSSANYSARFQTIKAQDERARIDFTSDNTEVYNKPFRLRDLRPH